MLAPTDLFAVIGFLCVIIGKNQIMRRSTVVLQQVLLT
jgi:hypothetical protein